MSGGRGNVLVLLVLALVVSGLAIAQTKYEVRRYHKELAGLGKQWDEEKVRWSKLTLEVETWSTNHEVDKLAKQHLGMRLPQADEVRVLVQRDG